MTAAPSHATPPMASSARSSASSAKAADHRGVVLKMTCRRGACVGRRQRWVECPPVRRVALGHSTTEAAGCARGTRRGRPVAMLMKRLLETHMRVRQADRESATMALRKGQRQEQVQGLSHVGGAAHCLHRLFFLFLYFFF